jgi:phosphoserine phosphatase
LVIISGGYENYLIYFKEIFGFDGVLGTQIAEGNGNYKETRYYEVGGEIESVAVGEVSGDCNVDITALLFL